MKPKSPSPQKQGHLLYPDLLNLLKPKIPLLALARRVPWETLEREFAGLYASNRLSNPIFPHSILAAIVIL